jgi:hypothetical protein
LGVLFGGLFWALSRPEPLQLAQQLLAAEPPNNHDSKIDEPI